MEGEWYKNECELSLVAYIYDLINNKHLVQLVLCGNVEMVLCGNTVSVVMWNVYFFQFLPVFRIAQK